MLFFSSVLIVKPEGFADEVLHPHGYTNKAGDFSFAMFNPEKTQHIIEDNELEKTHCFGVCLYLKNSLML